ncbi:Beta-glucosidase A [Frondihabitans sp. 762G35]|uniref:glycoside hydrolase family 1 protein n=1 Tax=Frondihabitans sp. 762G35 TaxID=1446794 RepID=UPI000D202AE9|nr:family 1 glycosylhydrolase [Frondihabitans sp. 762G35]ARC58642.1 Beta-glucosidase A [Frondihabitans sp. 762G35]
MDRTFPAEFLWGASTAAHQVEGNNLNSDWWLIEQGPYGLEPSGDADDSYHRYAEDMRLLADAGLNAYRFSIEWARIEPSPGRFSRAELAHYRWMIDTAKSLGLTPVVTLHHFTHPLWFENQGGWLGEGAVEAFIRYVEFVAEILHDVHWVCTINEPNMVAVMHGMRAKAARGEQFDPTVLSVPDEAIGRALIRAHQEAVSVLRARIAARVGLTISSQAQIAEPGAEAKLEEVRYLWEDMYLDGCHGDDFIGIQAYATQMVNAEGLVPRTPGPDDTLVGMPYTPEAIEVAVRHCHEVLPEVPILITENGIATADDERRIAYTQKALTHLHDAISDGVDVRGYLHWSALDNYEWGHWTPTFGLIAVDRETFARKPKPSLAWLGSVATTRTVSEPH